MGFERAFAYASAHEIFLEHARLSQTNNAGQRAFDIGGLAALTRAEFDGLQPIQWPVPVAGHRGYAATARRRPLFSSRS